MAKLHAAHRDLADPRAFQDFLDGAGALADRAAHAEAYDYDWHARKLDFERHFRALVLLHVTRYESARDLTWAAEEDLLFQALQADFDISVSGFCAAMRSRPIEPYWHMLQAVMQAVGQLPHQRLRGIDSETWQRICALFSEVDLFDASKMKLPPSLAEWAETTPEKSSFKLQLKMDGLDGHFKEALMTKPSGNDNPYFEELLDLSEHGRGEAGSLYLFDCGYFKLERYHEITETGNYFVTKLHSNIKPEEVAQRPVPASEEVPASEAASRASGYEVLKDSYVRLGGHESAWYRVLHVRLSTGEELTILTNLLWVEAEAVCLCYRYRWSIEIVFRWLKDLLQLDSFISRDPTGILRQLVVALVVWGLLLLKSQGREHFSPKQLWREIQAAMHQAIFDLGRRCSRDGVLPSRYGPE